MSVQVTAAAVSGSVTFVVAVVGAGLTYLASKRDRRRKLYGEAIKAALSWHEMLYRVRRRGTAEEPALISRFHDLQETITFYQGWIGSESRSMERSYSRLVGRVKQKTEHLITAAWMAPIRPVPGNALPADEHPDVHSDAEDFLKDVRSHLSLQPWRKIALMIRSTKY